MSAFETITAPATAPAVTVVVGRRRSMLVGVLAVGAVVGLCLVSYWEGGAYERSRFDAFVSEERRVAKVEADRQAAALHDVQAASDARAATAQAATTDLQGRIDAYVAQLSRRPVEDRCTLTDADLHGLRDLAPGGSAPRPHRRPARASRDED